MKNTITKANNNIAIGYCRVSTEDQKEAGLSLDLQEKQCREAAKEDKFDDIIIEKDEGKTGTKLIKRPAMQRIIKMAEAREIAAVYMPH